MIGVILAGGKSTRMGTDKSHLLINNRPVYLHLKEMLSPFCDSILISCNENNESSFTFENTVIDETQFKNSGPIAGILSLMNHTTGPWLFISCDVAHIEKADIEFLVGNRSVEKVATVFKNIHSNYIEPLIGIYEIQSHALLLKWFAEGNTSLRIFLEQNPVEIVPFTQSERLQSINTPELYAKLKNLL